MLPGCAVGNGPAELIDCVWGGSVRKQWRLAADGFGSGGRWIPKSHGTRRIYEPGGREREPLRVRR
jgi:hypothetical protein